MNINLLPIAIWLANYNIKSLRKTLTKWTDVYCMTDRQSKRDILLPGIERCANRLKEAKRNLDEMIKENKSRNRKIISF